MRSLFILISSLSAHCDGCELFQVISISGRHSVVVRYTVCKASVYCCNLLCLLAWWYFPTATDENEGHSHRTFTTFAPPPHMSFCLAISRYLGIKLKSYATKLKTCSECQIFVCCQCNSWLGLFHQQCAKVSDFLTTHVTPYQLI